MDNTDWKEKIVQLRKRDRLRRANALLQSAHVIIALYGNGEQAHIRRL